MGLDITAHSNLKYTGLHGHSNEWLCGRTWDDETDEPGHIPAYAYDAFPHALFGLPQTRIYTTKHGTKFLYGGCFAATPETETLRFSQSYVSYSVWRRELAELFNPYRRNTVAMTHRGDGPPSPEGPFYELLWFADNEGTIAELAAQSLLGSFRAYADAYVAAQQLHPHGDYNIQRYRDWTAACELAAAGGLISFC